MENIFLHKKVSYLQGITNDINGQDTSFLDCKHKHMMKSRALPDRVGVMDHLLPSVITLWLSLFFRDSMSPFNVNFV